MNYKQSRTKGIKKDRKQAVKEYNKNTKKIGEILCLKLES